jgi:hypothetical protein
MKCLGQFPARVAVLGLACFAIQAFASSVPIPQPKINMLQVASEAKRVDLSLPTFTHPTRVTNPLFPVSSQASVLFTGTVDNKPFRTEVTLLPYTRIVSWHGIQIEALVSQYVAYSAGRLEEVAYDLYAQADDGSVWYLGEDVSDFRDGHIFTKEGTWLAGKDGPPAMIMPGNPKVGDTYRTENMPGIAFEEVTVTATDHVYDGPLGPIRGSLLARELHSDGATEQKTFAPGYGEAFTNSHGDTEALALAVPTDGLQGPVPADLTMLTSSAMQVFDAAGGKNWQVAAETMRATNAAWQKFSNTAMPSSVKPILDKAIADLQAAVGRQDMQSARQAAIETARWSLDLQLRHRPVAEVDLARFDLWAAQVLVDCAAKNFGAVNGDMFALTLIRDRILTALDADVAQNLNIQLGELMAATGDQKLVPARKAAEKLRTVIAAQARIGS